MVIEGINHNPALEILSRDHRNYRLTGSRFFRTNNPSADYDFFVQYDRELIAFLENNKFSRYSGIPTYCENGYSNFLDNLRTQDILGIWRRGNVDVQVSMNAYKRQIIQKYIKRFFSNFNDLTKRQRREVWSLAYFISQEKI